ncbi:MAG: purple acid phosphatase family protein [Planctomycetota bacterium]|jgi:hypothetical protein
MKKFAVGLIVILAVTLVVQAVFAVPCLVGSYVNTAEVAFLASSGLAAVFNGTIVLGRPTDSSITINVLSNDQLEAYFEYGTQSGVYTDQTATSTIEAAVPFEETIANLQPNTRYYYRMRFRQPGAGEFGQGQEYIFHTQRTSGSTFTFTIIADSHLGTAKHCNPDLYTRACLNVLADEPDFHLDLGDTFRSSKVKSPNYNKIAQLFVNQRQFFGLFSHSAPVFLVIGNHECETGWMLDGTPDNLPVWTTTARKLYFPNPVPDEFYRGNTTVEEFVGLREDYYAWQWGDALFVAIEPWWYTTTDPKSSGGDNWDWTIGEEQYHWFKQTLEQSNAKYKFVFDHHLIGSCRGAVEWADFYEWGGHNRQGVWEFDTERPGWAMPMHQLMVQNGVTIFFQGHDHYYVMQELDGLVYLELPFPACDAYSYGQGGYESGVILPNSGHVRVTVSPSDVKVDYIRAFLPKDETAEQINGQVAHTFTVTGQ